MVFGIELNVYLFIGILFLLIFILGHFVERLRVPWIFAALILGSALAFNNPYKSFTGSSEFVLLANLGQYFLLFVIGFEIDLRELRRHSGFIIRATTLIIAAETIAGGLLVHALFGTGWLISLLVALAFATVGEAVLTPILDEFKLVNTPLGQTIIGIGTLDDLVEIAALMCAIAIIGPAAKSPAGGFVIISSIALLAIMALGLSRLQGATKRFGFSNIEYLFLFTVAVLFVFIGIGQVADAASLGSLLAGIALATFIPQKRHETIKNEVKSICYGLFAPIFLFYVGTTLDMHYVLSQPIPVVTIAIVTTLVTIGATIAVSRRELSLRDALLVGLGISVRFSMSTIIFKILFENKMIGSELYSVMIASSILVTFIVPIAFALFARKVATATRDVED